MEGNGLDETERAKHEWVVERDVVGSRRFAGPKETQNAFQVQTCSTFTSGLNVGRLLLSEFDNNHRACATGYVVAAPSGVDKFVTKNLSDAGTRG